MPTKMKVAIQHKFRNPVPDIQKNIVGELRRLGPKIVETVQQETPVRSGDLRDSARFTVDVEKGTLKIIVGNNVAWYGRLIEWGSVHNKPDPFVLRAIRKIRPQIAEAVANAARKPV